MRIKKRGAGTFIVSKGFTLLQQRSATEHEPLTWCTYGGMVEPLESIEAGCRREVREESGIDLRGIALTHIGTELYPEQCFAFDTFICTLPEPVQPVHSVETVDAGWFPLGPNLAELYVFFPKPLHSGMEPLLKSHTVSLALLSHVERTCREQI